MYLIFYSKYCKYSKKFKEIVDKINEDKYFRYISVDKKQGKRDPLVTKYKIKEVPTIIVDGRIYVGKYAFKWLEEKIKNVNISVSSQSTRMNKTPMLSAYTPDNSAFDFSNPTGNIDGNSNYSALNLNNRIRTIKEDEEFDKETIGAFHLPNDLITGSNEVFKDSKQDKASVMEKQYELMMLKREQENIVYKKQQSAFEFKK